MPADREWMARAACAGASTETFFPQQGENDKVEAAKRVCSGCPVRVECLSYALEHRIVFGVWGGTSEKQRKILRSGRHARPEDVMERVSRYLEARPDEWVMTGELIRNVAGNESRIRRALWWLIAEGWVERRTGDRGALLHRLVRPYRAPVVEQETAAA
ncbi:MAG TPA: WhiB family transcriptional regulator [Acidimicrobiales bacterium]|nr:WhiB family transcriptional regulator [Acidimicrobiales bacterium]